jgi:protease I
MARVGFIADDMVEDVELRIPLDRIGEAGHEVVVIGLERGKRIKGKRGKETFQADLGIGEVQADDFDALVIPGGFSPDRLRTDEKMVALVRDIYEAGKPLAAVCHGPWMLAEADIASGHRMTSWPSIRTDLENAGAEWVDQEVVEDGNLITSRKPADLGAFCDALLRQLENLASLRAEPETMSETREGMTDDIRDEDRVDAGEYAYGFDVESEAPSFTERRTRERRGSQRAGDRAPSRARSQEQDEPRLDLVAIEAGATTGPHAEERITVADVEEKRRQQAAARPEAGEPQAEGETADEEVGEEDYAFGGDASRELSPDDLEGYEDTGRSR